MVLEDFPLPKFDKFEGMDKSYLRHQGVKLQLRSSLTGGTDCKNIYG
jgi:hypothetical protein